MTKPMVDYPPRRVFPAGVNATGPKGLFVGLSARLQAIAAERDVHGPGPDCDPED